jgi:hypothetical protein
MVTVSRMNKVISFIKKKSRIVVSSFFEPVLLKYETFRISRLMKNQSRIILVYSIGKVGSSTVYANLKRSKKVTEPVFHIHVLNPERLDTQKKYYKNSKRSSIPYHLIQSEALIVALADYKGEIFVITLIREPISRELSSLYQDSFNFSTDFDLANEAMQSAISAKMENIFVKLPEVEWFNKEIKYVFDIDILEEPFECEKGHRIYEKDNVRLALIRLEDLNDKYVEMFATLFQKDFHIALQKRNESKEKFYSDHYQTVKKGLKFSRSRMEKLVSTPFIQKFYPDYQEDILKKWSDYQ